MSDNEELGSRGYAVAAGVRFVVAAAVVGALVVVVQGAFPPDDLPRTPPASPPAQTIDYMPGHYAIQAPEAEPHVQAF